jgi:hypothetical protein
VGNEYGVFLGLDVGSTPATTVDEELTSAPADAATDLESVVTRE